MTARRTSRKRAPAGRPRSGPDERTVRWLLSPSQPASRYRALRFLLGRPESDPEVAAARAEIPRRGWARTLLARQAPEGHWLGAEDLYRPKYRSTIWNFQTLADLGVTRDHAPFARTCELFLDQYARADGGFDGPGSDTSEICVAGNVTRALLLAGYERDPRVQAALRWIVGAQLPDGGWHCWPAKDHPQGTLDSWEGLRALSVVPPAHRTPALRRAIAKGAEFYLSRRLVREGRAQYAPWYRIHFPTHYYYDVLVGLDMLTALGYGSDARLDPALAVLADKRRRDGRWAIDRLHPDIGRGAGYSMRGPPRPPLVVERAGRPSRWVTGSALAVQRRVAEARARRRAA